MEGTKRANIKIGAQVSIVLKEDQRTGNLTEGGVEKILTNSPNHPHGIKVRFLKVHVSERLGMYHILTTPTIFSCCIVGAIIVCIPCSSSIAIKCNISVSCLESAGDWLCLN
jgi:uncharacterized repeat protein (TIGR03833 family)